MSSDLLLAKARLTAAEEFLGSVLQRDYPINGSASWEWGNRIHHGHVTRHGYGDRIEVENGATGKRRWISSYNIAAAFQFRKAQRRRIA